MKIVFIGAGNLATNLALEISQSEHQIVQVFSRTRSRPLLAEKVNCEPVNEMSKVVCDADLYIVSVKDDALEMLIPELCKGREDKMFVHTAGSMPMDVFKDYARHYGVFYPMQTFTKDKRLHSKIFLFSLRDVVLSKLLSLRGWQNRFLVVSMNWILIIVSICTCQLFLLVILRIIA